MRKKDFDWADNAAEVIVRAQLATAVYFNPYGEIVIRQEADGLSSTEDDIVILTPASARKVVAAVQELLEAGE